MRKETMKKVIDLWQKQKEVDSVFSELDGTVRYIIKTMRANELVFRQNIAYSLIDNGNNEHLETARRSIIRAIKDCKDYKIIAELMESFYNIAENRKQIIAKEIDNSPVYGSYFDGDVDLRLANELLQEENDRLKKRNLWKRIFNK